MYAIGKKALHLELPEEPVMRFCYLLLNAVELSLQSGCNTQLRTCAILVILTAFQNTTNVIVSN